MVKLFGKETKPSTSDAKGGFQEVPLTPPSAKSRRLATEMTFLGKDRIAGNPPTDNNRDNKEEGAIGQDLASSCCPIMALWRRTK